MTRIMYGERIAPIEGAVWFDDAMNAHVLEPTEPFFEPEILPTLWIQELVWRGMQPSADEVRASLMVTDALSPAWLVKETGSREIELPAGSEPFLLHLWRQGRSYQPIKVEPRLADGRAERIAIEPGDIFQIEPIGEGGRACMFSYFLSPFTSSGEERVDAPPKFQRQGGER